MIHFGFFIPFFRAQYVIRNKFSVNGKLRAVKLFRFWKLFPFAKSRRWLINTPVHDVARRCQIDSPIDIRVSLIITPRRFIKNLQYER